MRRPVIALVMATCIGGGAVRQGTKAVDVPPPANLLVITLDTTRADHLGAYGHERAHTPSLDALAARGTVFEQAFTAAPLTLPAHATMFTGMEPPEHGARVNGVHRLGEDVPTLAERLHTQGYRTGAFVAAFVLDSQFGLDRGFEVYDDDLSRAYEQTVPEALSVYRPGDQVVDAALGWLTEISGAPVDGPAHPFFAWVHLYDAHYPWHAHRELAGTPLAGVDSYDAEIAFMDLQVGRLVRFLDERGLADRTVVVALADHGEGLGDHHEIEHGYLLNEEVLRVPWIVAGPGVRPGLRVGALVSLRDLLPTALGLLAVEMPPALGARSLAAAFRGESIASRPSYAETDLPWTSFRWSPQRSLTTERWKYVRTPQPELYDRRDDRTELVNLASVREDVLATLEGQLAAFESGLTARTAEPAELDAAERERLASLGYVTGDGFPSSEGDAYPDPDGLLADVKERLDAKDLASNLRRGLADGTLSGRESLELARRLVSQSPETPAFHGRLGAALVDAGQVDAGIAALREALRLDPRSATASYELGDALEQRGRHEEARVLFKAALALDPDLAAPHVGLGNVWLAAGRADLAAGHYREAVRLRPGYPEAHFNLAQTLLQRRRPQLAIAHLRTALEQRPQWARAHFVLARVLREQRRPADAIIHYEAGLRGAPQNADAENDLGVTLVAAGRGAEARAHYEAALQLRPGFFRPHVNLGNWYAAEARWAEALQHFQAAHALAPDLVEPRVSLARFRATCPEPGFRDGERAVALAEAARDRIARPGPRLLDALAAAYAETGRFEEAADTARQAATLAAGRQQIRLAEELEQRAVGYAAQGHLLMGSG